jgi:HAD superfamily hydrolase (TIGR01549 family)
MIVKAVFFDVGETLIDETRQWNRWASYLGVPADVFRTALDDAIAKGEHHHKALERFRPGLDLEAARREMATRGEPDLLEAADLYPDALPCLKRLRELGYKVGISGNQPAGAVAALQQLGFEADVIASSATWGVEKPSPAFFAKVQQAAGVASSMIAYVGDRLDNDVLPAVKAGMMAIFIVRGPWGRAHARLAEVARAHVVVTGLLQIPDALGSHTT